MMKTKSLKYVGPEEVYRVSLPEAGDQAWEKGKTYSLPADNKHIVTLVKKGILVPSRTKAVPVIDMKFVPVERPEQKEKSESENPDPKKSETTKDESKTGTDSDPGDKDDSDTKSDK